MYLKFVQLIYTFQELLIIRSLRTEDTCNMFKLVYKFSPTAKFVFIFESTSFQSTE